MPSKPKSKAAASKNAADSTSAVNNDGALKAADALIKEPALSRNGLTTPPAKPTSPQPESEENVQDDDANAGTGVNRKKQKRRMKEAAKKAALNTLNQESSNARKSGSVNMNGDGYDAAQYEGPEDGDDIYYTDDGSRTYAANGYANHNYIAEEPLGAGKKKKKRASSGQHSTDGFVPSSSQSHLHRPPPPPPPPLTQPHSTAMMRSAPNDRKDRIWNTSTQEERERIKEFWLSLGEADRRSLVRIEKEAVLKKMKEQQKHSCSCTVCGRKRTAIEEELEVLYDAYYEELETYANHQQFGLDAPALPPPRSYARPRPPLPPDHYSGMRGGGPARSSRIQELGDDDVGDEEDYSDEDDEDDISDSEIEPPMSQSGGIFNFGNSLTAQGSLNLVEISNYLADGSM
ncbi:uncharacterized protein KY384_000677 [Bacidia gigantensis]|uniref:uncharacterized protein n=1 Tax=Bacidia gigantensis TaxID=2732470 RepID=UPI001D04F98D|nr:uncharacterized protein KY384_000677 [Bacidia gigantensis]KAG8525915.1 hypothetical protein KY384_000677 [Bacidia gigantensis]